MNWSDEQLLVRLRPLVEALSETRGLSDGLRLLTLEARDAVHALSERTARVAELEDRVATLAEEREAWREKALRYHRALSGGYGVEDGKVVGKVPELEVTEAQVEAGARALRDGGWLSMLGGSHNLDAVSRAVLSAAREVTARAAELGVTLGRGKEIVRAEAAEREVATLREALEDLLAPLTGHRVVLVTGGCNVGDAAWTGVTGQWSGDSWSDMHAAEARARAALAGAGRSTEGEG